VSQRYQTRATEVPHIYYGHCDTKDNNSGPTVSQLSHYCHIIVTTTVTLVRKFTHLNDT